MINFLKEFSLLKLFKIEINKYQVEDRTYANFVAIVVFILPLGGIISWFERPDVPDVAILQILVGLASLVFIQIARKRDKYLKFTFCMFLLFVIAYCFFPTGGIKGTLVFYWVESLILTWVLLSDDKVKVFASTIIHFIVFFCLMEVSKAYPWIVKNIYPTEIDQINSWELHGTIIFVMLVILMNKVMLLRNEMKKELDQEVRIDHLTGAFTRKYTSQLMNEYQREIMESNKRHTIALIDIDNFKQINDGNGGGEAGHAIGDEALVEIHSFLINKLRRGDIIGRWGGDEFLVIIPNSISHEVASIFKRIQAEMKHVLFTSQKLSVSLSIGIADMDSKIHIDDIIRIADRRMYKIKESGKGNLCYSN